MKKILFTGLAVCLVCVFAVPAMALDVDFSGFYRVRGFCYHDFSTFGDDDGPYGDEHSSDYLDMLLDVTIEFKVHPKLKLVTNFTALDKVWGEDDITDDVFPNHGAAPASHEDSNNIDWNQAYMEFVTGIGLFRVGRQTISAFEHPFVNFSKDADRILWLMPPKSMGGPSWNPFLVAYTFDKLVERDWNITSSDEDRDQHSFLLEYITPDLVIGNLVVFYREEGSLLASTPAGNVYMDKQDLWLEFFYTMIKLGPVKLETEISYYHGYLTDLSYTGGLPLGGSGDDDVELEAMAWFVQGAYDGGPFNLYAGWLHTDGDKDGGADIAYPGNTANNYKGQIGDDWDLLFFLTSDEGFHAANFGGMGNWSSAGNNPYGLDLLYLGGGVDITPEINLSGIWGLARADAVPSGSKKIGQEFNLWLTWQIMDGLQYKALFAFFDADDFWEDAQTWGITPFHASSSANDGSCWALTHQLTLSF